MNHRRTVIEKVRAALASEPRLGPAAHAIAVEFADGDLTLEGEVADVAQKKRALERTAALRQVTGIVDRLRVTPAQPMGDGEIRDHLSNALQQDTAFLNCRIRIRDQGRLVDIRSGGEAATGDIRISVADGVVTLDGEVPGLGHKRLAGVLAWWVPGSRDVVNGIEVSPPEEDNDAEITDALRLVLEKDPFVNAGQLQVGTHDCVVTLRGQVPTEAEKDMTEHDAWYLFGVDGVVNEIVVRA